MYYQQYGKKYKNIRTDYGGYFYASKLEASYARTLDLLKRATDEKQRVANWSRQFKVSFDINGYHITNHYVDFRVEYADGSIELIECKGMETDVWKIKRNLLEALYLHEHPEVTYKIIK